MSRRIPEDDGEKREVRRLSPEECQRVADSFNDLPPGFHLSAADLEEILEQIFGEQPYGSAEEAIGAMERRLANLKSAKAKTLDALEDSMDAEPGAAVHDGLTKAVRELNHLITEAQKRLEHYRFQQRQQN